ncbi:TPA: hypothetical protein SIF56_004473 [Escherichia coli]|nr:hypothetical protein [Escherichia coli]
MDELNNEYIVHERLEGFDILVPRHLTPNAMFRDIKRRYRKGMSINQQPIENANIHLIMNDGEGRSWVAIDVIEDVGTAKLDSYNYEIVHIRDSFYNIKIRVKGNMDVSIADIASDVNAHDGNIYVEGRYYNLNSMETFREEDYSTSLNIYATEEK